MSHTLLSEEEVARLKESLRRCPAGTIEAVIAYRQTGDASKIPTIVNGIIERYLEPEAKPLVRSGDENLRLLEDLGVDSLTMIEIVIAVEETLNISFENNELRELVTIGDVRSYMDSKATGTPMQKRAEFLNFEQIAAKLPQQPPFMFVNRAKITPESAVGEYHIEGNEFFLEGHFKNNPVFPASIMIEALGQLGVLFLLSSENNGLEDRINPESVYFTSCDGIRCHRVCRPGETLQLEVKLKRLRHPVATFEGTISVDGEKAAVAEAITLLYDFEHESTETVEMGMNGYRGEPLSNGVHAR
ncbi:MAG: phosphopantetheine-binding protein [Puniceicoccaceae bacterium]